MAVRNSVQCISKKDVNSVDCGFVLRSVTGVTWMKWTTFLSPIERMNIVRQTTDAFRLHILHQQCRYRV